MTSVDMLKMDNPEYTEEEINDIVSLSCPHDYGYADMPEFCSDKCGYTQGMRCWNREVLTYEHTGEPIAKVKEIYEENGGLTAVIEPIIKDSGDRTQFESGAVRDMRVGKGRCDLMPLEVVADYLTRDGKPDRILHRIRQFQKSNDTKYLQIALDNFNEIHWMNDKTMLLDVAKHFEDGAKKYGENNWQKGIPVHCYIDSAVRHYLKWLRGDKDEPHDRAFVWNLMCCIWEVDYHNKEE